jgi:peptide/nickel transport system substrate-binding protein
VVSERPMSLNPLVDASDPAVVDVGHLLYKSLLKLDTTGYPTADLAASYVVSTNGLAYTLVLKPNLEWSNGAPITTADVIATDAFALSPEASDPTLATALRGVKVAGAYSTVTFTLPAPRSSFPATLTQLPILPLGGLSEPALLAATSHPSTPMPTSGSYDVQSAAALAVVLQPNPHAAVLPAIKTYELRLFLTFHDAANELSHGSIGALLASTPEELATLLHVKGAQAESMTTPQFVDLMFNERVAALADSVVRHAIGIAINRSAVVTGALDGHGGVIQTGPFSAGIPWVGRPAIEAISPTVAISVLEANGWVTGAGGVRHRGSTELAFTLAVPSIDPLPLVARELATQLAGIGVQVTVDAVAPQSFLSGTLDSGDFQLAIDSWSPVPDPDVSAFWRSNAAPPHGYNVSAGAPDPFLDAALDTLAESASRTTRITAAARVAALIADDAPAVFLYTPRISMVFGSPAPTAPIPSIGPESARYDEIASWQIH